MGRPGDLMIRQGHDDQVGSRTAMVRPGAGEMEGTAAWHVEGEVVLPGLDQSLGEEAIAPGMVEMVACHHESREKVAAPEAELGDCEKAGRSAHPRTSCRHIGIGDRDPVLAETGCLSLSNACDSHWEKVKPSCSVLHPGENPRISRG